MEQKNNSGSIFKNAKKEKPSHPDYSGNATINGKEFRLAGWINKSKSGNNYLRLLFSEIIEKPAENTSGDQQRIEMGNGFKNDDNKIDSVILDDLPF